MQKRLIRSGPGKKVVQLGIRKRENALCKCSLWDVVTILTSCSRTYGEDTGEDIREGYEPAKDVAIIDDDGDSQFAIGNDEGESPGAEETRQWQDAQEPAFTLKPKYGLDGEEFENVWGGGEPSEPPKENP
jgi:hypothetical protein